MDVNVPRCDKESDNTCVSPQQLTELQIGRWNMILSGALASKPRSIKPDFMWEKWRSWQKLLHEQTSGDCIYFLVMLVISVGPDWNILKTNNCHEIWRRYPDFGATLCKFQPWTIPIKCNTRPQNLIHLLWAKQYPFLLFLYGTNKPA